MEDLMRAINYIKAVEILLNPILEQVKKEDEIRSCLVNALCHLENATLLSTVGSVFALKNKVKSLEKELGLSEQKRIDTVKNIENFIKKIKEN